MIPTSFDYVAAKNLDDALSLLAKHKDDAKLLAGGHSLLPAMKLRIAQPKMLIDISRIKDLNYIREEGGQVRIGAMTTHFQIETSDLLRRAVRRSRDGPPGRLCASGEDHSSRSRSRRSRQA